MFATAEKRRFIAAIKPGRFQQMTADLKELPLNKEKWKACWVVVFNKTTNELLVKWKDFGQQTETKYCLTNAFVRSQLRKNQK